MSAAQVQAAKVFIAKYKADLRAIELSGGSEPVKLQFGWLNK